jgi:protease-4
VVVLILSACACSVFGLTAWSGGSQSAWSSGDAVALIHLDGVIAGTGSTYQGTITPEYFVDQLKQAEDDPSVKAILIRADSPGGTAAASQEISMEIARLTKPVVVSVGDVCASGAYMIASQCDEIVATPTSSVGSIGVIAQIPNIKGLLDELGIEFQVFTAGEYKDAGSPYRSLTETETALYQEYLDVAYREFIRIVAEGRGMSEAEVEKIANGWMWPGTVALDMGLVDSVGTFGDALDRAAELGGIEGEPSVVTYGEADYSALLRSLIGFGTRIERLGTLDSETDALRRALPH